MPQSRIKAEVSSEDVGTGGSAVGALDGDPSTLWHTAWSEVPTPATYPHHITLDLGTTYQVTGFSYLPRQSGTNGMFKGYETYVSTDGQTWGAPVKAGDFPNSRDTQRVDFTAKAGRYVKFVGTSSLNGAAAEQRLRDALTLVRRKDRSGEENSGATPRPGSGAAGLLPVCRMEPNPPAHRWFTW